MRLLSVLFLCIIGLNINVFGELSSSSCSFLRTASSLTTIVPEIAQLGMRYYRVSTSSSSPSPPDQHKRQKRFLFGDNTSKDGTGAKGSVLEQMVANAFKDVNYTKVALLIIHNNDTMNKIRQNIDGNTIIRAAMREIDYEKLGNSLWYAAEAEFDLEYLISSLINITHMDVIYEELIVKGTAPEWFIKSIHPNLNVRSIQQMFASLKNVTQNFVKVMNSTERLDNYLFDTIQNKVLTPLGTVMQKVKNENPSTLDELVETILNNLSKLMMEQFGTKPKPALPKKGINEILKNQPLLTTTTATPLEDNNYDVNLLLYQCSIAIESIGQTSRIVLKALEQLYCASVWE